MLRWLGAAGLAVAVLVAVLYFVVEPPRILSWADWVAGGGRGAERVAEGVAFGSHGQKLDVWRPAGATGAGRRPVVIFYYGGGWVHGNRGAYAFAARAFAREGFVVVVPDYRKVPAVRFPAFLEDAADSARWVQDHVGEYGGDPARVAVAGHSAGAYSAVMLAVDPRWLRAAGVRDGFVKAAIGLCGPYDFYPFDKKRSIDAFQGVKDGPATQPVNLVSRDAPPLLLVTASRDTQVRPYNAVNLFKRVQALGGRAKFVEHDGLSHEDVVMALSKPFRGKAPVLAESVAFLHDALGTKEAR